MAKSRIGRRLLLPITGLVLAAVVALGMGAGTLVGGRWQSWVARVVVWLIGSAIAFLLYRLLKGSGGASAAPSQPDLIDAQIARAKEAMRAAGLGRRIGTVPAVLLLGPRGSAKSTLVMQSGLDSEHLAGDQHGRSAATPTEALNLWYHEGHLLIEAGGALVTEQSRWVRLVDKVKPDKWIPALLRRPQSPRVAVVCYSAEDLLGPSGLDKALAAAGILRERLTELSESIGIRLPVYVVFTKSDSIPHFAEFAENLTESEIREILGTTMRALGDAPAGAHKERERARVRAAFDVLYQSLAERRLQVLGRAGRSANSGKAYEFPREFNKLSGLATQFLLEICRPSELRVSPFLRGFYFTGVRPITVAEGAPTPHAAADDRADSSASATQVFSVQQVRQHQAAQPAARSRRIPQWVFLESILKRVVLQDHVAMGMTTGGFGLAVLRRGLLAVSLAALLVVGVGVLFSQANDRRLRTEVVEAIRGVENVRSPDPGLASREDLDRLDRLREATRRLSSYENGLRPLRNLVWLYSGGELYPLARRVYFDRFERLQLNRARRGISATLDELPDDPTLDQREQVYNALRAHVEMTDYPQEADSSFFAFVLSEHWTGTSAPTSDVAELARAQFAFYGSELQHGNPYSESANNLQVSTARAFLSESSTEDSFYQALVSQSNGFRSFSLARDVPGSEAYLSSTYEVQGTFTTAGWDYVQEQLTNADQLFERDLHVVGNEFFLNLEARGFDADAMVSTLRTRYEEDYVAAWSELLSSVTVVRPDLSQASGRMEVYGSSQSALFRLLATVNENTRGKSPTLDSVFIAVRMLTAPDSLNQLFSDQHGAPYLDRIRTLAQAAGTLAESPGSTAAQDAVRDAAANGVAFVGGVAVAFPTEPRQAMVVSEAVGGVLRSPFDWARGVAGQGSVLAANRLSAAFCSQRARVLTRYPFVSGAQEASWQELDEFFNPDGGAVFDFRQEAQALGPLNANYQRFMTTAQRISESLYQSGGPGAGRPGFEIAINFDGIDTVEVNVDGTRALFTENQRRLARLPWDPTRAEEVTLTVRTGNQPQRLAFEGTWGLFRLFRQASSWENAGRGLARVRWGGLNVAGEVRFTGEPLLDPAYFQSFSCPQRIAG